MTLVADVFPKLRTQKKLLRSMPQKSGFNGSFEKTHSKGAQTLLKCQGQLLYHIYWSLWRQLPYKESLLVIYKISRLFPNTLSMNWWIGFVKLSVLRREYLPSAFDMLDVLHITNTDFLSVNCLHVDQYIW